MSVILLYTAVVLLSLAVALQALVIKTLRSEVDDVWRMYEGECHEK